MGKVYLKNYVPEGQVHAVMDPITGKKQRPGFLLFADACDLDIPNKDSGILLRQNKETLSNKALSKKAIAERLAVAERTFSMPRGFSMNQLLAGATITQLEDAIVVKKME